MYLQETLDIFKCNFNVEYCQTLRTLNNQCQYNSIRYIRYIVIIGRADFITVVKTKM